EQSVSVPHQRDPSGEEIVAVAAGFVNAALREWRAPAVLYWPRARTTENVYDPRPDLRLGRLRRVREAGVQAHHRRTPRGDAHPLRHAEPPRRSGAVRHRSERAGYRSTGQRSHD